MKCNKCGEECTDNQTFCLKCGNRIQEIPDLNLIEEELANSIGELMDEMEEESNEDIGGTTRVFNKRMTFEDNVSNDDFSSTQEMNIPDIKDESLEFIEIAREHGAMINKKDDYQVNALNTNKDKKNTNKKKNNKSKLIIGIVGAIIALGVIIAVIIVGLGNGSTKKETFEDVYNDGVKFYTANNLNEAINAFQKAINMTDKNSELIKSNKSLYDTYMKIGIDNLSDSEIHECIDILKTLISLDKDNIEHYKELINFYTDADMTDELEDFKESLVDTKFASELGIKSVAAPIFEEEPGKYGEYITVGLMYESGCNVYYTLDGSEPNENSKLYEEPIELEEQGTIEIKAVAIDEEGKMSDIVTGEYTIKLESIEPPVVTPSGGKYSKETKIEVEVPEGMKAYYTIDEYGIEPTIDSEEYKGPIDMPRGKYVFSVILVDESGMSSEVVENIYNYEVERNYTYDEAYDVLIDELIVDGTIMDESGIMYANDSMEFSYKEIAIVDNNEYYLIEAVQKDVDGKVKKTFIYGIDTVQGDMVTISVNDEGEYEID